MKVLILSGTASAINYIKSLGGDPSLRLHVTDTDRHCPGLYAPGVVPHWLPPARETAAFRKALDRIIGDHGIEVLIPTSDYDVAGVVEYLNEGWTPPVALFRPDWQAHQLLANKQRLAAHLAQIHPEIVPRTWRPETPSGDLDYPVVLKPVAESGGKGIEIVRDAGELAPALARIRASFGASYVIQQFVPGRTYIVSLVYDQEGRLITGVPLRSHLTFFTWGGGGCAGEIADDEESLRLAHLAIAACGGWRGPINVEWRRHEATGKYYILEANCRLNGYSYLTTMNGVCLPRLVLSLLTGEALPPLDLPPAGQRRNFVLGFRETAVERWIEGRPSALTGSPER